MHTTRADGSGSEFITVFAEQRQRVLRHAGQVLTADAPVPVLDRAEAVPKLAALLTTSLEELKVAEEELVQQHEALESSRAEMEGHLAHYRMLFDLAPAALLLTDLNGAIRDANRAAAALLHREVYHLERKPLAVLVPRAVRAQFREELSRVGLTAGVANWHFVIERPNDVPLGVSAAVHLVPHATLGSGLYWQLRSRSTVGD